MTHEEFVIVMGVMEEYFEKSLSEEVLKLYWEAFKDWEFKDFKFACSKIIEKRVYSGFPKIAEIKNQIYGNDDDEVNIAYSILMEALSKYSYWDSVNFEDGAIGKAIEAMGGWIKVSELTIKDWQLKRKEFEALYRAYRLRGIKNPIKLMGYIEKTNVEKGYVNHMPEIKNIPKINKIMIESKRGVDEETKNIQSRDRLNPKTSKNAF